SIRDNGTGLSRAYAREVFSLFYSNKGRTGTGLGLFIAHRSVKQHNGEIRINSTPGEFTEFIITLPTESINSS
ncbi:MAG: HAMP domain-containing histidine kinase, partial [Desulfobacterales bacterium]|nr:HAMP domain-containing histidine kinase [Desulfobacterales bacterium]